MESPRIICIDENGKKIERAEFRYGFALYKVSGQKEYYFKNRHGRFSNEYFLSATPYKNGFAEVETRQGEFKYRNIFGEVSSFMTMEGRFAASIYDFVYQENLTRGDINDYLEAKFFIKELAFSEEIFLQTVKRMNVYFKSQPANDYETYAGRILLIKDEAIKTIRQKTKDFSEGENEGF